MFIEEGMHSLTRTVRIKYMYYFDVLENVNHQYIYIAKYNTITYQAGTLLSNREVTTPIFLGFPLLKSEMLL